MKAVRELYRRYLRPHRWTLRAVVLCFLCACIGHGALIGMMGRYMVDEVLEVDRAAETILRGRKAEDSPARMPQPVYRRGDRVDESRDGDDSVAAAPLAPAPQTLSRQPDVRDGLADRLDAREGKTLAEKLTLIGMLGGAMVACYLLTLVMGAWARMRLGAINKRVVYHLRRHIFDKLLRLQMKYHDGQNANKLIGRAVEDVRVMDMQVAHLLAQGITQIGMAVVFSCVMLWISWRLAVIVLLIMPVLAVSTYWFRRKVNALARQQREEISRMYGLSSDRLANQRVVKGFCREKFEELSFFRHSASLFRRQRKIVLLNNGLSLVYTLLLAVAMATVLGAGAWMVQRGTLSIGSLMIGYGMSAAIAQPMIALSALLMQSQHLVVVTERLLGILGTPVTICDRCEAAPLERIERGIELRGVRMTYEGTTRPALRDVHLHLPAGRTICLMGQSGSGKTTLAAMLLRLYDPDCGQVLVDGRNVRGLRNDSLRRKIAYVPQEPLLFSGTVASNIAYGQPHADGETIVAAARAAEIHGFIETLPEGYQTIIGEKGMRLSGGQKQRLSLARALITDPQVLVLDDCTSALDAHTEARIRRTLEFSLAGKTVIMISHRASAARAADLVVVMRDGAVAEVGTHEQLLARRGEYWRLVQHQLREAGMEPAEIAPAHRG